MKGRGKWCPQCAELVKPPATICGFCRYEFNGRERVRVTEYRKGAGARTAFAGIAGLALVLLAAVNLSGHGLALSRRSGAALPADPSACERTLQAAEQDFIIRSRPSARRIDVEDRIWRDLGAEEKRVILDSLLCVNAGGEAVAYGHHSARRVATIGDFGVRFE